MKQPESLTSIGKAMRQLYEQYGAAAVLTNKKYLINGLGDLARIDYTPKLRSQMALAMDAGLGRLYLEQLERGKPDDSFNQRVYNLLTLDAGLSDAVAQEIVGYFNEMMGWNEESDGPVPGNETAYQQILYYDKQGRQTDKDEVDNAVIKGNSKKIGIIIAVIIIAAVLVVFFIIKPILNNTTVPQQANTTTVKYLEDVGKYIFNPQLKILNRDLTIITDIPEKEGYTFVEWNTKSDGSGDSYSPGDTYTLNKPLVLYAQWKEKVSETVAEPVTTSEPETTTVDTYTVTYDANGGTGAPAKQTVKAGSEFKISSQEPIRKGYVFSGWSVTTSRNDDSKFTTYSAGATYRITKDLKLYAQWTANESDKNGWEFVNNKWQYYLDGTLVTGWKHIDGAGYYFDKYGFMVTGWQNINGETYYFDESGKMTFGWLEYNGSWYYFDVGGRMASGKRQTIDGKVYDFYDSGELIDDEKIFNKTK